MQVAHRKLKKKQLKFFVESVSICMGIDANDLHELHCLQFASLDWIKQNPSYLTNRCSSFETVSQSATDESIASRNVCVKAQLDGHT